MKKGLIILTIILTIIISTNISIYAEEYKTAENIETTREPEQMTEETIYFAVTFIDEVRNTRVVKTVKCGDTVEPEWVSKESIYLDKDTFQVFDSWVTSKNDSQKVFKFTTPIIKNTELYAMYITSPKQKEFNPPDKTIRFDSQGGNKVNFQMLQCLSLVKEPETPIKEGYKFLGWYTEAKGGEKWSFKQDKVRGSMTLYAHWEYVGTGSNVSPQTGHGLNLAFAALIMCLGTAVFSSVKLSYKE